MAKRTRFIGGSSINTHISEALRSGQEQAGQLNIERVPLARIQIDPHNPRATGLSVQELEGIADDDPDYECKSAVLDRLKGLADSIRVHDVQQPIKIYRHGDGFRILYGERRYLASMLAGKDSIPAWILRDKPKHIRMLQYVENVQREDLTPWERLQNVQGILEELERYEQEPATPRTLAKNTGVTERQASTYFTILNGPRDVQAAMQRGWVNNLEKAAVIAQIQSPVERHAALEACAAGASLDELRKQAKPDKATMPAKTTRAAGRPATKINLGSTTNSAVIRGIIERIAGEGAYADTDWSDFRSVATAWKQFLKEFAETHR